jgi:hypothetical protein
MKKTLPAVRSSCWHAAPVLIQQKGARKAAYWAWTGVIRFTQRVQECSECRHHCNEDDCNGHTSTEWTFTGLLAVVYGYVVYA